MTYGRWFYRSRRKWVVAAAHALLPTILGIAPVRSIADVGCGTGLWVKAVLDRGIDAVGIDGPWVAPEDLEVDRAHFITADLGGMWDLGRRFDMAMSLEVGEHLPPAAARRFVDQLTSLAPVVVFSAAIPGQGGQCHVNEQWPSYWIDLFSQAGFQVFDILRPHIWRDEQIPYWYRQNILVFASRQEPQLLESLAAKRALGDFSGASLVHPEHSLRAIQFPGLGALARALPFAFVRTIAALPSLGRGKEPEPLSRRALDKPYTEPL